MQRSPSLALRAMAHEWNEKLPFAGYFRRRARGELWRRGERKTSFLQNFPAAARGRFFDAFAPLWRTRRSLGDGGQFDKKAISFQTAEGRKFFDIVWDDPPPRLTALRR